MIWYRVIDDGKAPEVKGKYMKLLRSLLKPISSVAGFTMIELLIVISILGILAVAVLSAINPIEQINRGRDTGSQSDAEQLLSAIDRYHAFNGTYPWQGTGAGAAQESAIVSSTGTNVGTFIEVTQASGAADILDELKSKDELKSSFVTRITNSVNPLFIFNQGGTGNSTYICFAAKSKAFKEQADTRCGTVAGASMSEDDMSGTFKSSVCAGLGSSTVDTYHCLP